MYLPVTPFSLPSVYMAFPIVSLSVPGYDNIIFTIFAQDITGQRIVSPDKYFVALSSIYSIFY